jgi:hypothetical protein
VGQLDVSLLPTTHHPIFFLKGGNGLYGSELRRHLDGYAGAAFRAPMPRGDSSFACGAPM